MSVIRVRQDVYQELKRLRQRLKVKSMSELIELLVDIAKRELDKTRGDPRVFLKTLKYAGDAGENDSERIDELLYGGGV